MRDEGFVLVWRGLIGNPQFRGKDDEYAAMWLILRAAWKETTVRINREAVTLKRGECAYATSFLATAWECSKTKAYATIKHLENAGFIRTQAERGYTRIYVVNYDTYQKLGRDNGTQSGTQTGTPVGTTTERGQNADGTNKKELNTLNEVKGESLTRSSAPARDLTEAPPQPKGVIESETPSEPVPSAIPTPSEPSTPPTEDAPLAIPEHLDRRSPEARERFALIEEAISLAQPLKFATKDSFNARQSINALIRQGADPEALRDLAGQCHISQTTHGEFMTRAQKLLPAEIQSAIKTNEEASHVQRARPVHDPIAAAANAARARHRGT